MDYDGVLTEIRGNVARITLNRPEHGNALGKDEAKAILRAAIEFEADPRVRAVLITGTGRMFCAGGDVNGFLNAGTELPAWLTEVTIYVHAALVRLARMRAPVIAAVNGPAAGGGFSLAISADLVVAAASARFKTAYTGIGLSGDLGVSHFLPRLVGLRRAQELMLTNRALSAAEALDWGLINRVVPDADLIAEAERLAAELAAGPTRAFGAVKALFNESFDTSLETQLGRETELLSETAATEDCKEALNAFLAKRAPGFQGR